MGVIKLYTHQREGLSEVKKNPYFGLFMEMGTGKTLISIMAIKYAYQNEGLDKVIVFCPKSITYNWELELEKFLDIPYILERLEGNKKQREKKYKEFISNDLNTLSLKELHALGYKGKKKDIVAGQTNNKPLMILVLNFEKGKIMERQLNKFKCNFMIVDESHQLRGRSAQRAKSISRIGKTCDRRITMTGTPMAKGYEDLYMQYKIMNPDIFGDRYKDFEMEYIKLGGFMGKQIVGYRNVARLRRIMKRTTFQRKLEECVDIPPITHSRMFCALNPKARKAYNEMNEEMLTMIQNEIDITRSELKEVLRDNLIDYHPKESFTSLLEKGMDYIHTASCDLIITKIMRLQQIAGGFIKLDTGKTDQISDDKYKLVLEVLDNHDDGSPIIICCQYVAEIEMLMDNLSKLGHKVQSFRDKKNRDKTYRDFQKGKIDILILQLSSGSVGLNLQLSHKMIMYSWNTKYDDYVQIVARIKRNGQTKPMQIINIIATDTRDLELLRIVQQRKKLAHRLLK